jgi:hypothetical protein
MSYRCNVLFAWLSRLRRGGLVPLEVVLVVLIVVVVVAALSVWIWRARSCRRTIDVQATEPQEIFGGDVMCRYLLTSGSLGRLEIHDWGVRLRGIVISKWIVPTWEARYSELARAELVAMKWSRITVWLRLRGEPGGIGFLTMRSRDILDQLEQHDVAVSRAVTQISRVDEMYRVDR